MLLCNVYVLYSSMEERYLAEWGSLKSNQIKLFGGKFDLQQKKLKL